MKLLLIGASGVLGSRLYNDAIKKKWNVLGTYCSHECEGLSHLDLTDRKSIEKIFGFFNPEAVVLAGAISDVDLCELKPKLAEEINIKGSLSLVRKIKRYGVKLVFLSTDYIFNGEKGPYKEEDDPSPINVYGRTKLEIERAVKDLLKDYLVIRTSQLYGFDFRKKNFAVKTVLNMRKNKKIYAADDFYSTPTYIGSLSGAIIKLLEADKNGIFNVAGIDFLNRHEYVNKIANIFMLDKGLIERVKLKDLRLRAKRPMRTGLKIDKIKREIDLPLYNCKQGLELFKKEI